MLLLAQILAKSLHKFKGVMSANEDKIHVAVDDYLMRNATDGIL